MLATMFAYLIFPWRERNGGLPAEAVGSGGESAEFNEMFWYFVHIYISLALFRSSVFAVEDIGSTEVGNKLQRAKKGCGCFKFAKLIRIKPFHKFAFRVLKFSSVFHSEREISQTIAAESSTECWANQRLSSLERQRKVILVFAVREPNVSSIYDFPIKMTSMICEKVQNRSVTQLNWLKNCKLHRHRWSLFACSAQTPFCAHCRWYRTSVRFSFESQTVKRALGDIWKFIVSNSVFTTPFYVFTVAKCF